jgi:hypothetical protein
VAVKGKTNMKTSGFQGHELVQPGRFVVGLLTGWMNGRLFVPPAFDGIGPEPGFRERRSVHA